MLADVPIPSHFLKNTFSKNDLVTAYSAPQNTAGNPRREHQSYTVTFFLLIALLYDLIDGDKVMKGFFADLEYFFHVNGINTTLARSEGNGNESYTVTFLYEEHGNDNIGQIVILRNETYFLLLAFSLHKSERSICVGDLYMEAESAHQFKCFGHENT